MSIIAAIVFATIAVAAIGGGTGALVAWWLDPGRDDPTC